MEQHLRRMPWAGQSKAKGQTRHLAKKSSFNEELEIFHTERSGNWERHEEEFQKDGTLCTSASIQVKDCYEKVEAEDRSR